MTAATTRRTQAERRETTRSALIESAASALALDSYSTLTLEAVASEAGYSRGAVYHLFASKDDLVLAVIDAIRATIESAFAEASDGSEPLEALVSLGRGYAQYARSHPEFSRAIARLNHEFAGQDGHPVGEALGRAKDDLAGWIGTLVNQGRRQGTIPTGTPSTVLSRGIAGALEGLLFWTDGQRPHDVQMAERLMRGLLAVDR